MIRSMCCCGQPNSPWRGNSVEDAKSYLSSIIEREPENAKARSLQGEIYVKEGLKEKAWEEYLVVLDAMMSDREIRRCDKTA